MFLGMWFLLSVAVGILASNRGRSGVGWMLIAAILSPLLGFIFLLVAKDLSKTAPAETGPSESTHTKCPACAEWVLPEASICKHCGASLTPDPQHRAKFAEKAKAEASKDSMNLLIGVVAVAAVIFIMAIAS